MAAPSNVQIPITLFKMIVSLFEYLDISGYEFPVVYNHNAILTELRDKQHRINLNVAYTKAATASDDVQRRSAHACYLMLKKKR